MEKSEQSRSRNEEKSQQEIDETKYITLELELYMEACFGLRNLSTIARTCIEYSSNYNPSRNIYFKHILNPDFIRKGDISGLHFLFEDTRGVKIHPLEIRIEGTDEPAKKFAKDLERCLREQADYANKEYLKIKNSSAMLFFPR